MSFSRSAAGSGCLFFSADLRHAVATQGLWSQDVEMTIPAVSLVPPRLGKQTAALSIASRLVEWSQFKLSLRLVAGSRRLLFDEMLPNNQQSYGTLTLNVQPRLIEPSIFKLLVHFKPKLCLSSTLPTPNK